MNEEKFQEVVKFESFANIDFRIATIKDACLHPNADKLLVLKVDDGSTSERQLCAGIKEWYSNPEELIGSQVVIVANLEPRVIRGIKSEGMVLAASYEEESTKTVSLIRPEHQVFAGSKVS